MRLLICVHWGSILVFFYSWLGGLLICVHWGSVLVFFYSWLGGLLICVHWGSILVFFYSWLGGLLICVHWGSILVIFYSWLGGLLICVHWGSVLVFFYSWLGGLLICVHWDSILVFFYSWLGGLLICVHWGSILVFFYSWLGGLLICVHWGSILVFFYSWLGGLLICVHWGSILVFFYSWLEWVFTLTLQFLQECRLIILACLGMFLPLASSQGNHLPCNDMRWLMVSSMVSYSLMIIWFIIVMKEHQLNSWLMMLRFWHSFLACLELLYMVKIHSGYICTACIACSVSTCGDTIPWLVTVCLLPTSSRVLHLLMYQNWM